MLRKRGAMTSCIFSKGYALLSCTFIFEHSYASLIDSLSRVCRTSTSPSTYLDCERLVAGALEIDANTMLQHRRRWSIEHLQRTPCLAFST